MKVLFEEGNSQAWSVCVCVCVYDSLIYGAHVARVAFAWPMLIRPWRMKRTEANIGYTNIQII